MRQRTGMMLLATALLLGACAAPAERSNMTVSNITALAEPTDTNLNGGIAVGSVDGGQETNPLATSEVGNEDFQSALTESMRNHGLLTEGGAPHYILYAHLLSLQQPVIGLNMTVTAKVKYELVDAVDGLPTQEKTIETEFTSPFSDAFAADERTRLASEGAIRENIREFLNWLSHKPPPRVSNPMALR